MDQGSVQTALFSATYDPKVMEFAKKIVRDAELITVRNEDLSLENIHQYYVRVGSDEEKIKALRALYGIVTVDNAIVFCRVTLIYLDFSEINGSKIIFVESCTGSRNIRRFETGWAPHRYSGR